MNGFSKIKVQKYGEKRKNGETRWYKVVWIRGTPYLKHILKMNLYGGAFGQSESQKEYNKKKEKK